MTPSTRSFMSNDNRTNTGKDSTRMTIIMINIDNVHTWIQPDQATMNFHLPNPSRWNPLCVYTLKQHLTHNLSVNLHHNWH